jgi:hypothetical protein
MINPIFLNYALLVQFAALTGAYLWAGDRMQAVYWGGAFACTAGVTFR